LFLSLSDLVLDSGVADVFEQWVAASCLHSHPHPIRQLEESLNDGFGASVEPAFIN